MCKTTYTHSKNRKPLKSCFTSVMKIRLCECSVKYELSFRLRISSVTFTEEILNGKLQLSFYHKDYYFRLCTCRTLKSSCTNAVYNEIVGKLFRLCRCRTIKSSCENVVRIRLCKLSIQ